MCVEVFKGRMTIKEARTALTELVATTKDEKELEHYLELSKASDEEISEIAQKNQNLSPSK
jgi:hypothetical protein